ncbi:MAG: response regulator [Desulfuromonadales bacterium]|nr:response regulator [Desulfuromonadales bacterium]
MSLVGNLEDLGLGEILQIVSLSRKSGVLELVSGSRVGRIIFYDGQVTRAVSSAFPENLGDLLLRGKLIDFATLKSALVRQQETADGRRLGDILAGEFGVAREAIETVVREQIERVVYSFFGWSEGTFSFELGEPEELAGASFNPLQFMLDQGLNPQWLAMEGSRIIDEKRHRGETDEEQGESVVDADRLLAEIKGEAPADQGRPEAEEAHKEPAGNKTGFLIVDDDPLVAEQLAILLQQRQVAVRVLTDGADFLQAVATADPEQTALVIDLMMPRRDGSGILGGLELVEAIRQQSPGFQVMVMADHPNPEAEQRLQKLGVPVLLRKPKRSDVSARTPGPEMGALVESLLSVCAHGSVGDTSAEPLVNLGAELMRELGEPETESKTATLPQSPGLHLLRGMLEELNNPALGGGIILLILRFASELMNRAMILLVKEREIAGLGQFGIGDVGESADIRVRGIRIPKNEPNLFSEVLQDQKPYKVVPGNRPWDSYLFEKLGGGRPAEVFVGPLISEGRVVAVLYGDNLLDKSPIGDTETLEIFLSKAGLAMEKALQERRAGSHGAP